MKNIKQFIAREYLTLLKYFLYGYLFWIIFVLFILTGVAGDITESFWWFVFLPFNFESYDFKFAWIFIVAPYLVFNIVRSIGWAKREVKK